MFARVITALAGEDGFDDLVRLANQELPEARQRPGFTGYLLLTDDDTGDVMIISLWQTREDMEAVARGTVDGVHGDAVQAAGLRSLKLHTFEVPVHA